MEGHLRRNEPRRRLNAAHNLAVWSLCLLAPLASHAFNTLDGDRTAWPADPSYRITNRSADVRDGSDAVAVRRSFSTWQDVPTADIAFREVARGGDITVSFLAQWPREFGPDAAGVTITQRARGVISSAEVSINEANFDWSTSGDPARTDIEGVVTHEVGHALGLGHSRVRAATMYWSGGDLVDAVKRQATTWFGTAVEGWMHLATVEVPRALPDESPTARLRRITGPRLAEGLWICGDHCGTASINGGLASGRRCAETILATG